MNCTARLPAIRPVAKHVVIRYPPVGASQSSISPAQNIPGLPRNIKFSSIEPIFTPPEVEIAVLIGPVPFKGILRDFILLVSKAGSLKTIHGKLS